MSFEVIRLDWKNSEARHRLGPGWILRYTHGGACSWRVAHLTTRSIRIYGSAIRDALRWKIGQRA